MLSHQAGDGLSVTEREGEGTILFLRNRGLCMWLSCFFKSMKLSFMDVKTDAQRTCGRGLKSKANHEPSHNKSWYCNY